MKIIIGLGNIGEAYSGTRHNFGFYILDQFAKKHDASWQHKPKLKSEIAELKIQGEKIILIKPTTLYNLSGEAALAIKQFYKVENSDIIAIHDELALPFGVIRTRPAGSDAGNNGIKSLNQHLGDSYWRIRVGASGEGRVPGDDTNYVLGKFTEKEHQLIPIITEHVIGFLLEFTTSGTLTNHTINVTL